MLYFACFTLQDSVCILCYKVEKKYFSQYRFFVQKILMSYYVLYSDDTQFCNSMEVLWKNTLFKYYELIYMCYLKYNKK